MATGALRIALVAAGLVIGIFVLANAFPDGGEVAVPVPEASPGDTAPTGATTPDAGDDTAPGDQQGGGGGGEQDVSIQVLNATDEAGLAQATAEFIQSSLGYQDVVFGDASTDQDTTTIHFASGFRPEARKLRDELHPDAELQGGTAGDAAVDITVVLGADYVQAN